MGKQKRKNTQGKPEEEHKLGSAVWLNQSVNKLVRCGHRLPDIKNYTLTQFLMFVDAADQIEAGQRIDFVTDMSVVVGSLFAKSSPAKEHLGLLKDLAAGAKSDGDPIK